jgi:hypothetical protein
MGGEVFDSHPAGWYGLDNSHSDLTFGRTHP